VFGADAVLAQSFSFLVSQGENAARSLGKSLHSRQGNSSFLKHLPPAGDTGFGQVRHNQEEAGADQALVLFFDYYYLWSLLILPSSDRTFQSPF